mmetsp:Transcript_8997/g.18634  ORF Transcript_8997/g.18634 Transcript_8997/m.18634 type:complete len:201 (+) Transcript_8997:409-1011(+)
MYILDGICCCCRYACMYRTNIERCSGLPRYGTMTASRGTVRGFCDALTTGSGECTPCSQSSEDSSSFASNTPSSERRTLVETLPCELLLGWLFNPPEKHSLKTTETTKTTDTKAIRHTLRCGMRPFRLAERREIPDGDAVAFPCTRERVCGKGNTRSSNTSSPDTPWHANQSIPCAYKRPGVQPRMRDACIARQCWLAIA